MLMAICVEGHVGRFAACHFGHKVSNTGLSILTDAVVVHASRRLEIDSGAFVDDFLNAIMVLSHALCAGLAGGCLMCREAAAATQLRFDSLDTTVRDCAFVFSTKGDMSVSQRHVFLGIIFDTHDGRLFDTGEVLQAYAVVARDYGASNMLTTGHGQAEGEGSAPVSMF